MPDWPGGCACLVAVAGTTADAAGWATGWLEAHDRWLLILDKSNIRAQQGPVAWWRLAGTLLRAVCCRLLRRVPAAADRARDDLDRGAEDGPVGDHLPVSTSRAAAVLAVMSPNPTVENTVTVKYSPSVCVSRPPKLPAERVAMTT